MKAAFIILFVIAALFLIILLVIRDQKDEKKLIEKLKKDYHKPTEEELEGDTEKDEMLH